MASWIETAEAALGGTGGAAATDADVDVLRPIAPPVFDAEGVRAVMAPIFAAFMWAAAVFREIQSGNTLDPVALIFRLVALAMTVRAITLLVLLSGRIRLWLRHSRYGLAVTRDGILYRTPDMDLALPREDIVEVRERGLWRDRGGRRYADVYVVTQPASGRLFVAIPPIFERTPGVLAERLMRWLGAPVAGSDPDAAQPSAAEASSQPTAADPAESNPLANELWERVARGEVPAGTTPIRHGLGWLQRGPYVSMLLGVLVVEGFFRLPPATRNQVGIRVPLALVAVVVLVPIAWFVLTRIQLKPRRGLAAILTPTELLLRTRTGVLKILWSQVQRLDIESRASWSLLTGAHESRSLIIRRKQAQTLKYHESFIAIPLEVLSALCDAYRKARIRS